MLCLRATTTSNQRSRRAGEGLFQPSRCLSSSYHKLHTPAKTGWFLGDNYKQWQICKSQISFYLLSSTGKPKKRVHRVKNKDGAEFCLNQDSLCWLPVKPFNLTGM
ncbi:hypothetical protein XELAEV_18034462mg [Xenopus laevis]|uniref:Uncharacterized protein n=1 Tax=Xenopus laevis TaxID=8355 RepID=A0A974CE20_XENLA|nr:hypothetical protein XELAEV_18034462mg [Xenopus laevis]